MFTLPVLLALAVVAVVTSFISGIFGMAGGMLLIGFLLVLLPVPVAMVFHGVIQIAANGWRAWLWRHHVRWSVVLQFGSGAAAFATPAMTMAIVFVARCAASALCPLPTRITSTCCPTSSRARVSKRRISPSA